MGKIITLLMLFILALGSLAGYLILNQLIDAGDLKVSAGQILLAQGEQKLAKGKARLASGERQLSKGKRVYGAMKKVPLLGVAAVTPAGLVVAAVAGAGEQVTGNKIAEGNKLVAQGKGKIQSGEKQLEAGKLELSNGIKHLNQAKLLRLVCGFGTIFFFSLLLVLGFYWRRGLLKPFRPA